MSNIAQVEQKDDNREEDNNFDSCGKDGENGLCDAMLALAVPDRHTCSSTR